MAWGTNTYGQVGDGTTSGVLCQAYFQCRLSPVPVVGLSSVLLISAGAQHSLALLSSGSVFAWGDNSYGQAGNQAWAVGIATFRGR